MMGVLGNDDDALEAALGLGELAGLTVSNDADSLAYDVRLSPLFSFRQFVMFSDALIYDNGVSMAMGCMFVI